MLAEQKTTNMTAAELIRTGSKFTNLSTAHSYANRAFETANKSLHVLMIDCPYYIACSGKEASILLKKGYEFAPNN